MNINAYLKLVRFDNWPKNFLMFIGVLFAYLINKSHFHMDNQRCLFAFFALCFASSANYVLNEYYDKHSDSFHPIKKQRSLIKYSLKPILVIIEYCILLSLAVVSSLFAHLNVTLLIILYIVLAWVYNVQPFRAKDIVVFDVLLESLNYPIRVLIGWLCIFPNNMGWHKVLVISWTIGGFTMSIKRLAEYQIFDSVKQAIAYRKSYANYSRSRLIGSALAYGIGTILSLSFFAIYYKPQLLILLPLVISGMWVYFSMGLNSETCVIYPERLIYNKQFILFSMILFIAIYVLI